MTVSYTLKVANARFGGFSKLLFRWKGSIYKLLYKEFLVFITLYTMLSLTYRSHYGEGPGQNLPFSVENKWRLLAMMTVFFGSGFVFPFVIVRHQLLKK